MAIRGVKLLKILEQEMQNGRGNAGFKDKWRGFLGITEGLMGDHKIDYKTRVVDPKEVAFDELARTFLGREFGGSHLREAFEIGRRQQALYGAMEAEGTVVLPSHFANISAFTDTVAGLLDALMMEAYLSPEFIVDQVMEVKDARVQGGKMIGVRNDGGSSVDLLDNEPYPAVGLTETYIDIPDNQRHGNTIQINEKVFIYDRTDQVQQMAENAGLAIARTKEITGADYFLGITNNYARDGNTSNTYLTAAGDVPNNFVNSSTNQLIDYHDIDQAIQVLEGNTDPQTGFEITVPREGLDLLVMPQNRMNAENILSPEWIRRFTPSASYTDALQAKSPLPNLNLIVASRIWYNRLIASGVNTTNAPERWHLGRFKKAFQYRQIIPFQTFEAPLSSEDVRRDIVLIKVAREHGTPFVKEPRYSYQGTKE